MKDVSLFQCTWKFGRVTAVYKGSDGLVRVVDVINGQKTYRRPVHKLVKLIDEENESSCREEDIGATSGDSPSPSSGKIENDHELLNNLDTLFALFSYRSCILFEVY